MSGADPQRFHRAEAMPRGLQGSKLCSRSHHITLGNAKVTLKGVALHIKVLTWKTSLFFSICLSLKLSFQLSSKRVESPGRRRGHLCLKLSVTSTDFRRIFSNLNLGLLIDDTNPTGSVHFSKRINFVHAHCERSRFARAKCHVVKAIEAPWPSGISH